MVGGMHGRVACVAGSVHGRGVWWGACMAGGMCGRGHAWQGEIQSMSGQYASMLECIFVYV